MWKNFFAIATVSTLIAHLTNTLQLNTEVNVDEREIQEEQSNISLKEEITVKPAEFDEIDGSKLTHATPFIAGKEECECDDKLKDVAFSSSKTNDGSQVEAHGVK